MASQCPDALQFHPDVYIWSIFKPNMSHLDAQKVLLMDMTETAEVEAQGLRVCCE